MLQCILRSNRDVSKHTEPHGTRTQRMMARRTHRTETSNSPTIECHVHCVKQTASARRHRVPRPFAHHCIRIQTTTTLGYQRTHLFDVRDVVRERNFFNGGMPPFVMLQRLVQRDVVAQRARNSAQPADVFRMPPTGIVAATVGIGYKGDASVHT